MNTNNALTRRLAVLLVMAPVLLDGQMTQIGQACNGLKGAPAAATWTFAVSGDSRNCGDVVMPAIAVDASKHAPEFYWHLGDFRLRVTTDEDMQCSNFQIGPEQSCNNSYFRYVRGGAWKDFIENQVYSFGTTPVLLGIGNHEMIGHTNRDDFVKTFSCWLDAPAVRDQRFKDDKSDTSVRTYYHWTMGGIDFINLDNAGKGGFSNFSPRGNTDLSFTKAQITWLETLLKRDAVDPVVKAVVAGMHAALPDSFSYVHSMSESRHGIVSGRSVYNDLWDFQNTAHKPVYVLASHSHYYMENIYNTNYWQSQGRVLPGWIIGTAGARRYALPKDRKGSKGARTNVYGYLLATVNPDGKDEGAIQFEFHSVAQDKVPKVVANRFNPEFVSWCFKENTACKKGESECEPDDPVKKSGNSN